MSEQLGEYTFLPWLRQGVARSIEATDGDTSVHLRATAKVELSISGTPVSGQPVPADKVTRNVELYGPGEVIGIEGRSIIRTDPRPWITNAEPNYLPFIEFYEEDFPWRYTPSRASDDKLRLRPWLALVVLEDTGDAATSEFRDAKAVANRPLPFISVRDFTPFPIADELWAWAHVHVNGHFAAPSELVAGDVPAAVDRVATALHGNPDLGYSRIVCPRRLKENAAYHAFLIPSFERGRLAGLGKEPDKAPYATSSAWADYANREEPLNVPYYHRWYFRTGGVGDFESLVRLLSWETVDPRVGRRDMDVLAPGTNMPAIPDLGGVLRLGGALRAPLLTLGEAGLEEYKKFESWAQHPYPHEFQKRLAAFINLADDYTRSTAKEARTDAGLPVGGPDDVDPVITAPIYGEWQALQHRLLKDPDGADLPHNDNWIHELNLDPRHRVAAGFGGDVVRARQEDYMEAAWKQVGDVLAHNQKVRVAKTWVEVNEAVYAKSVAALAEASPSRLLAITAPVQKRILYRDVTTHFARQGSLTPPVLTSPTLRRIVRPRGPLQRRLGAPEGAYAGGLLEAVNTGKASAAPPVPPPSGAATVESAAAAAASKASFPPQWLVRLAHRTPRWLLLLLVGLAVLLVILALFGGLGWLVLLGALIGLVSLLLLVLRRMSIIEVALGPDLDDPDSIDQLGASPAFVFGEPPSSGNPIPILTGQDNDEAKRFKEALRRWGSFQQEADAAGTLEPPVKLDLGVVSNNVAEALRPATTIEKRFLSTTEIAPHVSNQLVTVFDEVRYYPRIDEPMYRPLKDLDDEHFVPNLDLIKNNTVVALETNQDFIEAYMVGVNSEFSRELLWREYPADQRGSYFRQFWDVTPFLDPAGAPDADEQRERLYDIPMIHGWLPTSKLGEHDNRQPAPGVERDEIVLVIRGELLKKYPNTVIYAHAAQWAVTNGHVDPTKERSLVGLTAEEFSKPPHTKVRTPMYEAKVEPDIYFFGFDLTAEEAKGKPGDTDSDPAGWFFVLRERPGEPRFGLDESRAAEERLVTVNDLAWSDTGVAKGASLPASVLAAPVLVPPSSAHDDLEKQPQYDDDVRVVPAPVTSARWAYLLFQAPVMVAVHAADLLKTRTEY